MTSRSRIKNRDLFVALFALALGFMAWSPADAGVNQWTSGGPEGGGVNAIAFDPSSPTTLYLGTSSNGVFKSTDMGASWFAANEGMESVKRVSVAADGVVFALHASSPILYKSQDGGVVWSENTNGLGPSRGNALAVLPGGSSTLFIGTSGDGVLKSTDGGVTFLPTNSGLPMPLRSINSIAVTPSGAAIYVGISSNGVYKSTDGGANWVASNIGVETRTPQDIVIDPVTPPIMYAATGGEVYKSSDGGASWAPTTTSPQGNTRFLAIDPSAPTTLFGQTLSGFVARSIDSGETWESIALGVPGVATNTAVVDPSSSNRVLVGSRAGVSKSINGGDSWNLANTGLLNFYAGKILVGADVLATIYATDGSSGVRRSSDGGVSWALANQGLGSLVVSDFDVSPSQPLTLYAVSSSEVYRSTNGAQSWDPRIADLGPFGGSAFPTAIAVDPTDSNTVYVGNDSFFCCGFDGPPAVLRSSDGGANWQPLFTPPPPPPSVDTFDLYPRILAIDRSDVNRIFFASDVWVSDMSGSQNHISLHRTVDGGQSWIEVKTIDNAATLSSSSLLIDPVNSLNVYLGGLDFATREEVLYKSVDGGDTWSLINPQSTTECQRSLAADPVVADKLYLGCLGLFVSSDGAGTWSSFDSAGLPSFNRFPIQSLAVVPASGGGGSPGGRAVPPVADGTTIHAGTRWGVYSYLVEVVFADGFESGDFGDWGVFP